MPPSRQAAFKAAAVALALVAATTVTGGVRATAASAAAAAPTPTPSTGQGTLTRVAGADRVATSILISQTGFPTGRSATAVVLARADDFADALAGSPLAAQFVGPFTADADAGIDSRAECRDPTRAAARPHCVSARGASTRSLLPSRPNCKRWVSIRCAFRESIGMTRQ